ncbi:hypothetical protein U9M48_043957 [Paspalum notatum var. saurae]|uniref:Uncharacterized protein n=1 Tax=Paspalum notatum var. saurae TaxID=547442 RepID=A0AAQ3UVZ4_PASNO
MQEEAAAGPAGRKIISSFFAPFALHTILWYQLGLVTETLVGVSNILAARRGHKFVPDLCHSFSHSRGSWARIQASW